MPLMSVRQFAPLMRQTVQLSASTGTYDFDGQVTYGANVAYQCAVVGEIKTVLNGQGQEVPSAQAVYLMSNAPIRPDPDYKITLSTGDAGSTETYALSPPILAVSRYPFTRGQFATVLYLGAGRAG